MNDTPYILERTRNDLFFARIVRIALFCAAVLSIGLQAFPLTENLAPLMLMGVGLTWVYLTFRSARASQNASFAPQLIAAGKLPDAEALIHAGLGAFALFPQFKLRNLHNLAILRHAQGRFLDAAMICRDILGYSSKNLGNIPNLSRLLMADSFLRNDLLGEAHQPLFELYSQRLSLMETLNLLSIQNLYLSKIRNWDLMLQGLKPKLDLIDLMPPRFCMQNHQLLLEAAQCAGKADLAEYLKLRLSAIS
jgi:hypothetical protein